MGEGGAVLEGPGGHGDRADDGGEVRQFLPHVAGSSQLSWEPPVQLINVAQAEHRQNIQGEAPLDILAEQALALLHQYHVYLGRDPGPQAPLGPPVELHHVPSTTPGCIVSPTPPGPAQLGGRGRSSGNAMLAYWSLRGQGKVFLFCDLRGDP